MGFGTVSEAGLSDSQTRLKAPTLHGFPSIVAGSVTVVAVVVVYGVLQVARFSRH